MQFSLAVAIALALVAGTVGAQQANPQKQGWRMPPEPAPQEERVNLGDFIESPSYEQQNLNDNMPPTAPDPFDLDERGRTDEPLPPPGYENLSPIGEPPSP